MYTIVLCTYATHPSCTQIFQHVPSLQHLSFQLLSNQYFLGGTNKSQYVIGAICGETVRVGRLDSCLVDYLRTGHSKTDADKMFANIATALAPKDYFNHLYLIINCYHKNFH